MKRQTLAMTLLLLVALLLAACVPVQSTTSTGAAPVDERADWPEKFVVGIFGGDDADEALESANPFQTYLQERLGIPVEIFVGTSYSAVIEAMRADRVDAMIVGPFAYVLAVEEAQAEALGVYVGAGAEGDATVYDPEAPAHYLSVIFTKKGSGVATLEDLKGKDFAFVDPASTSGHLAPKTLLIKNGIDPDTEMNTVFAGSHPTAVITVWNDKTPAGATFENNLVNLAAEGQVEYCGFEDGKTAIVRTAEEIKAVYDACPEGKLVIIAFSDPIPSTPFAIRTEMPASFKAAVREAILTIKDDAELVQALEAWYVDPSEQLGLETLDQYYNSLRDIAKLLNLDLQELAN